MIETRANNSVHLGCSRRFDDSQLDDISFFDVDLRQGLDPSVERFVNERLERMAELERGQRWLCC